MNDRRRINGPQGGTTPPVFADALSQVKVGDISRPRRIRKPQELRKIFLQTGLVPSASGSAYLELSNPSFSSGAPEKSPSSIIPPPSLLKLTCAVHGPRPLPRSAPFTPHLLLTTHIKFAPFATRLRRGYVRDATERDLAVHLETALRGVIIGDRWPKSGVEVVVTVLEGEEDRWWGDEAAGTLGSATGGWGLMAVLAGCINVASAAIADAGIDCVDLVSGGVAAVVGIPSNSRRDHGGRRAPSQKSEGKRHLSGIPGDPGEGVEDEEEETMIVLDPSPSEHGDIRAACVVGYLSSRDEITEMWAKGELTGTMMTEVMDEAIRAAAAARIVQGEILKEALAAKSKVDPGSGGPSNGKGKGKRNEHDQTADGDVTMVG